MRVLLGVKRRRPQGHASVLGGETRAPRPRVPKTRLLPMVRYEARAVERERNRAVANQRVNEILAQRGSSVVTRGGRSP